MPIRVEYLRTRGITLSLSLAIAILLVAIFLFIFPPIKQVSSSVEVLNPSATEPLKGRDVLSQSFVSTGDYERFGIYYWNYLEHFETGNLLVTIQNSSGDKTEFTKPLRDLQNEAFCYFDYHLTEGEEYTVTIGVSEEPEYEILTFLVSDDPDATYKLSRSHKTLDKVLVLDFTHPSKDYSFIWYILMSETLVCCYIALTIDRGFYDKRK